MTKPPVIRVEPEKLSDLFLVFEELQQGRSVQFGSPAACIAPSQAPPRAGVWLGVCSSGSTGQPKLVWRLWDELLAGAQCNTRLSEWTWASSYEPQSFAGVQVALQAWRTRGHVLSLSNDWPRNWQLLIQHQPDALSCTPTFLDLLLQFEQSALWAPRQVTLGGEVLRPAAGRRFRQRFPETRFTVIYAAAELGILLKTHRLDGWYETRPLGQGGVAWRVQSDVLELRRGEAWVSTGDRVEVDRDIIRVLGRADSVANIGGVKVNLESIGQLAEEVPGVRRAVAFSEPNPIVGQIVCLKYALDSQAAPEEVRLRLEQHLRGHLRKEAWPRRWELDEVGMGKNSKRVRA